jgi:photosystem II stability/assembly factor-like uncharacterized protein
MKRVYVGTERGLELMAEGNAGWQSEGTVLADYEISAVTKRADGRLYVATRQAGLFLVDPQSREAAPVGAGQLPAGLRCVAVSPTNSDIMFVGCEPAAIFKSTDGGTNWSECLAVKELAQQRKWQYHIPQIPSHIRQILVDRRSPQRLYAAVQIGGVILSEDGGASWQDVTDSLDPDVHAITQDRDNADVLYASTGGGGPMGGPHPPVAPAGFAFYRSKDAGKTWNTISAGLGRSHAVPLHLHPGAEAVLVAAAARGTPPDWRRPEGADAILLVSRDRGESWSQLKDGLPTSFPIMVDSIDTENAPHGRTYLGIGGEGTKVLPPEMHRGSVYYADGLDGTWQKLPREFPVVYTVTAA